MKKKEKKRLREYIGWYGVCAILVSYATVSFGVLTPNHLTYQLLNLTGAVGIIIEAYAKKDYQPALLNIIWMLIALVAIINILMQQ